MTQMMNLLIKLRRLMKRGTKFLILKTIMSVMLYTKNAEEKMLRVEMSKLRLTEVIICLSSNANRKNKNNLWFYWHRKTKINKTKMDKINCQKLINLQPIKINSRHKSSLRSIYNSRSKD